MTRNARRRPQRETTVGESLARASGWADLAAWYDAKQGDRGDLWHRALIDPTLLRVVGGVRGKRLLDLGCGNGYLSRRFARQGAHVTAVDTSSPVLRRARARERKRSHGIAYRLLDAARLEGLGDQAFDLVVCNMALMDIEDARGAIHEVARVLRPGGRFVTSLCHPCFDNGSASAWSIERVGLETTVYRKISRYRECFDEPMPWRMEDGSVRFTRGYHRPLSWYAGVLRDAGFAITRLEEPEPAKELVRESPQGPWIAKIPLHLVIEALKVRGSDVAERRAAARGRVTPLGAARRQRSRRSRP